MKCRFPGCPRRSLLMVAGVHVCTAHWEALEASALRDANLDCPALPRFRFVRRRHGFETWFSEGRMSSNLTCQMPLHFPLAKLSGAQGNARAYAKVIGIDYVDEERVLPRETLRELFTAEVQP